MVARPGSRSPGKLIETFPDVPDELGVNERHFNAYRSYVAEFGGVVHDNSNGKLARTIHPRVLNTMHWCCHPAGAGYRNISAVSQGHVRWLEQYMPEGRKIPVVHHGINPERFTYREEKDNYYLFFSVLAAYKGAFEALMLAKETGAKIVFAGREGDASGVLKAIDMPNIDYYGEVSNRTRAELMSRARALIFPTGAFGKTNWLEVFGLVQLEALASGTPVVASDNGACPEIIEHGKTGFVCKTHEEMKEVIEENRVDQLSPEDCRRMVEEKFSAIRMAKGYIELYKKLEEGW